MRGRLTEKIAGKNRRTLSHEHTIFRDAIFPDACARTWWQIGGGKKTPPISRRAHDFSRHDFSRCLRADVVANRRGQKTPRIFQTEFFFGCLLRTWWGIGGAKKHPPHSALPSHLPAPTLACAASGGQALGSGASKGQQSIDDRGLAPRSSMASHLCSTPIAEPTLRQGTPMGSGDGQLCESPVACGLPRS